MSAGDTPRCTVRVEGPALGLGKAGCFTGRGNPQDGSIGYSDVRDAVWRRLPCRPEGPRLGIALSSSQERFSSRIWCRITRPSLGLTNTTHW